MTEQELREKIIGVLTENFTDVKVVPVYTREDGLEIELPQELCDIFNDIVTQAAIPYFADALIAADIGDVSEYKGKAQKEKNLRELVELFHKEKCHEYDLLNYQFEKMKHRAEVAEKKYQIALKNYAQLWRKFTRHNKMTCTFDREIAEQAEKELAEEKKDD